LDCVPEISDVITRESVDEYDVFLLQVFHCQQNSGRSWKVW